MPAFSIHCPTCQSRLKVRDESAIGQIVACPKCGSMVMIEAPEPEAAPPIAPPLSAADMPDTVGDSQLANSFEEAASWFDDDQPEEGQPSNETIPVEESTRETAVAAPVPPNITPPSAPPPPGEQSGEPPLMPGDSWMSATTQHSKRIALVAGAGVLGIVAVVGLAFAVANGGKENQTAEVTETGNQPEQTPAEPIPPEPEPAPPIEPPTEPIPAEVPAVEPPIEPAPVEVEDPPAVPQPKEITPEPVEPPKEPLPPAEPPLFAEKDPPPTTPPANSGLAALDALLPLLDGPPREPPPAEAEPVEIEPPSETPDPLLAPEIDPVKEPPADDEPSKPEPRLVEVQARLADPIEAIEFPSTTLVDFFRLMSDFSTIPITLDPVALTQLKISPDDQIAVVMGQTTVGEVLQRAASRKNLLLEIKEDRITITHNRETSGTLRQANYSVSDLLDRDPQELDLLRQMLITHVAPGTWQETGGVGEVELAAGSLLIRHTEPVHHAAVLFIEQLRAARGRSLRSSYDPLLFNREARNESIQPKLSATVSLNYFEKARLREIIGQLETSAGLRITVDWNALLAAGWTPDTEAKLILTDATLAEAFDKLLTPRGLTYRVINPHWVQLTTPAALAEERLVEFHPAAELLHRKQWQPSDLQAAILAELPVAAETVRPVLGYDQASGCLIVSGSVNVQDAVTRSLDNL